MISHKEEEGKKEEETWEQETRAPEQAGKEERRGT
jgi:hypothetical protein